MAITIYGIRNCNTMKKAFAWLDAHGVAYAFHDYKKQGIDQERLMSWCARSGGWEHLVNRSGLTFRGLPETTKQALDEMSALLLMVDRPSVIRRPVIDVDGGKLLIGFSEDAYAATFLK